MIRAEKEGELRVIWIDRPQKRNALTLPMIEELRDQLRRAAADDRASGVVVAGAGGTTCAGVDLNEFASGTPATARRLIDALAELCAAARVCPKPTAMAIEGHCYGGGLELACACDFRVATRGALLAMPEVMLGIPSVIDAALIERHIGRGRALQMIMTGDPVSAEEALGWGLLNGVASPEGLLDSCFQLLRRVTRHDPEAIRRQKALFGDWLNLPFDEGVERSKAMLVASFEDGTPQRLARERLDR